MESPGSTPQSVYRETCRYTGDQAPWYPIRSVPYFSVIFDYIWIIDFVHFVELGENLNPVYNSA